MSSTIIQWANLIRDIGLILGIPTLIIIGMKLYGIQINTLKQQNELLRETQYDRALSLLNSQKELFNKERDDLEKKIDGLQKNREKNLEEIERLRKRLDHVVSSIKSFEESIHEIQVNFRRSSFRDTVNFVESQFLRDVDFYN